MRQHINEHEKQILKSGIKLYPGDILLGASSATNFEYELSDHTLDEYEKSVFHGYKYFKDKFEYLDSLGMKVTFTGVDNETLNSNLMLIDTQMPIIIGSMLKNFFRGKASKVSELAELCIEENPCNISDARKDIFYTYKIKELLTSIALGMMPATPWNGHYEATGGYIIVKEDGDVLCYHIYNRNEFREYLFENTKFDTPSKTKHHFGMIEEIDNKQILKLNLQIRFIK